MTPGALGAAVVVTIGVVALLVVGRRRRDLVPWGVLATSLALVLVTTLLPTHPSAGSSGAQWELVPTQGGVGTALRHLAAGKFDAAVQVVVLLAAVYLPLGAALAVARSRRPRWLLLPLVVSIVVEVVQYRWLGRVGTLDDVLVAMSAAVVGWVLATRLGSTAGTAGAGGGRIGRDTPHEQEASP